MMKKIFCVYVSLISLIFIDINLHAQSCVSCPTCFTAGSELVTNGNFAFSAPYAYTATAPLVNAIYTALPPVNFGNYSITNNPNTYNSFWCGADHSGGGTMMLMCDGYNGSPTSAWGQYINISTIAPNTNFTFCFYAMNILCPGNLSIDPLIQMYVNGAPLLGAAYTLVENNNQWVLITGTWNSGNTPPANVLLEIATTSYSGSGNDFAIDDISFKACLPSFLTSASNDTAICKGKNVQLLAAGAANYAWAPATGLSSTSTANPVCNVQATTTYTVSISNGLGCTKTESITVTVNQLPAVNLGSDTSICNGNSLILNAGNYIGYQWQNGNTTATLNVDTTGTYTVTVSDANGCSNSDAIDVTVNPLPVFNATPAIDSTCAGTSVSLSVSTNTYNYTWSPGLGLSATTGITVNANPPASTTYTVTGTNGFGCTASSTVSLTINALPNAGAGANKTVCKKDSIALNGSGGVQYSWLPAGSLSNANIANPKASPQVTTTYTVTVTDINGCTATSTMKLKVNALPVVKLGSDTTLCKNIPIVLNGNNNTAYTFLWQNASTNINFTANDSGTYYLQVTDTNNCKNADTVVINYYPSALITLTSSTNKLCIGDSAFVNAGGGVSYNWSPAYAINSTSSANVILYPDSSTTYILTVADSNACQYVDTLAITVFNLPVVNAGADTAFCFGNSVNLLAMGGANYSWLPAAGLSDTAIANPVATPVFTTNYIVHVIDSNGCRNTDSVLLTVHALPIVNLGNDTTLCTTQQITLATAGTFNSYLWQNGDTNATITVNTSATYVLSVVDSNTCTNTDSVDVSFVVCPPPVIGFSCTDTLFCEKQCIDFNDLSTNNPTSWLWTFTGASPISSTMQNPANICYNNYGAFDVQLIACNVGGCDTLTLTQFVQEFQTPAAPVIFQTFDSLICPTTNVTYAWYNTNNPNNILSTNYYYIPTVPGNYYVLIADSNGCAVASNIIGSNVGMYDNNNIQGYTIINDGDNLIIETNAKQLIQARIFNLAGQVVKQQFFNNRTLKYIVQLPPSSGIYLLELVDSDGGVAHYRELSK